MTAKEVKERVLELGANEGFMQKLESAETREDLLALLKENGIQDATESILAFLQEEKSGELKDSELEEVAGGMIAIPTPRQTKMLIDKIKKFFGF